MLPESLSESYEEYKADTKAFVTWLSLTAVSKGYKLRQADVKSTTARLKGKARKEAKSARNTNETSLPLKKHIVSVKELVVQAECVASPQKPPVKVPLGIQYVLKRAINARRKCAAWFENLSKQQEHSMHNTSNANHQHFISILESVYCMLEPHFTPSKSSVGLLTPKPVVDSSAADTNSSKDLANRFKALKLEELDQDFVEQLVSEETNVAATKASTMKPVSRAADAYELGAAEDGQLSFAIFCVLEELQELQSFIQQTWQEVVDGKRDQIAASLATNVALTLARKAVESLIANLPQPFDFHSYVIVLEKMEQSAGLIVTRNDQKVDVLYSNELTYCSTYCYMSNFNAKYQCGMEKGELGWVIPAHEGTIHDPTSFDAEKIAEDRMIAQILHELLFQNIFSDAHRSVMKARHAGLMPPLLGEPFKPISDEIE
jgi:hypothetical protein